METFKRFRRLKKSPIIRDLIRETVLTLDDIIYPLFVVPGKKVKKEISSMPDCYQFSIDMLIKELKEIEQLGIKAVLLFGIPEKKDEFGSDCYSEKGIIQRTVREIKKNNINLYIITDVCMCEYTTSGHCGIIKDGCIDNDGTIKLLTKSALTHVQAGADMVAPSDMMDGRVKAIREILDENGFVETPIMSYAIKYASSFYAPFRDAVESAPQFGDRKSHQLDPGNIRQALLEAEADIQEGADVIMVKPAMAYLDVISKVREKFNVPIAAYNVSGEYAMVKASAKNGWIDEKSVAIEMLLGIKRAGADLILTYFGKSLAKWL
jgi:porphobilinogen synthase